MTLKIDGVPELTSSLDAIASGLDTLTDAPDAVATSVTARARALAPKATGRLAGSIRATSTAGRADVGVGVDYGIPVHFGTRYQRARPFLFDAVTAEQSEILEEWTRSVQRLIDKEL